MDTFLPYSDRNLIITGSIGSEQATIVRQIAERLRMPFISLEALIAARVDLPADEIRAYYGETRLKAIEAEIVQETTLRRNTVIRISGRTLFHGDNMARLRQTGEIICLTISLGAMLRKLHISMGARFHDPNERALALAELKREWAVNELEDLRKLDVTYMADEAVVTTIVDLWRELSIQRG